jgi:hypothetical protein
MITLFKSKIDKLATKKEKLEIKKNKIEDRKNKVNAILGARQKAILDKTYINKDKADAQTAEIDRQLKKIDKLINIEVDYAKELGTKFKGE